MPQSDLLGQWFELLLPGLWVTLRLSAVSFLLTGAIAVGLSMLSVSEFRPIRWLIRSWIEVFRSIPILALMIFLYFGIGPQVESLGIEAFWLAVAALSLSSSAYLAEVYRGAILSVPRAQWSAAMSLGMRHSLVLRRIIIPQIIPPLVPSTLNALISVVKFSSLASLITVNELTLQATQAVSLTFYPLQIYILLGLFYAIIIIPLIYALKWVERWTKRRYGVVSAALPTSDTDPYALGEGLELARKVG